MLKTNKQWQATLLSPVDLARFLSPETDLSFIHTAIYKSFIINKIEDVRQFINFPLPPHRKTVFEFIFLTA